VGNSLGRIKIQFPNDFDVYLHDTPKRSLFDRRVRAFSHGCMRVEKVVDLASALLGPEWPSARINEAIAKGDTKVIKVTTPRRVDVLYLTAWVDPETGVLQFRDDIYKHDVPPTDDGDVKAANNHP
jgi:murein L,D-transpeptidase YcbB/YkuD